MTSGNLMYSMVIVLIMLYYIQHCLKVAERVDFMLLSQK